METKCSNPDANQDSVAKCISQEALKDARSDYILNSMAQGFPTSQALKDAGVKAEDDKNGQFVLTN